MTTFADVTIIIPMITDAPVIKLELGRNLDKAAIKEGSDVYFDCIIDANPVAKKVYWTHNVSKFSLSMSFSFTCGPGGGLRKRCGNSHV